MEMKHFSLSEFDSPDSPGSGKNMKSEFLKRIDEARGISGCPYKINSGFRTQAHNKKVGGVANSSHTKGWAADISAPDGANKQRIVEGLIKAGFKRIGVYETFIHCDCDPDLPTPTLWTKK